MTIITTTTLSPQIIQSFPPNLLASSTFGFSDDEKMIWKLWLKFEKKFHGKYVDENLKNEFLEIYGKILEQKKSTKATTENKTERFFYRIEISDRILEEIFIGFRFSRSIVHEIKPNKYGKVPKIQPFFHAKR